MEEERRKKMRGGREGREGRREKDREVGKDGREGGREYRDEKKQFNAETYGQEAFCSLHGILGIVLCCQCKISLSYLNNFIE